MADFLIVVILDVPDPLSSMEYLSRGLIPLEIRPATGTAAAAVGRLISNGIDKIDFWVYNHR